MLRMELGALRRRTTEPPPLALESLLQQYDPEVIDLLGRPARIRLAVGEREWDALLAGDAARLDRPRGQPDASISAGEEVWRRVALDARAGLEEFRRRRLRVRRNLHLSIGFIAATSGLREPGRLRFASHETPVGRLSTMEAGRGEPLVCLHGLGGTKASFLTTIAALAPERRVIAVDLPGFGDSAKPLGGRYDAPWFADAVVGLLDRLGLERLSPRTMFVWGRRDRLVPIAFSKHVRRALPAAEHVVLDCGHVPQLEAAAATHAAVSEFLSRT
jgi:hypothetical protein